MELRILTTDKNISLYGRYTKKNDLPAFDWPNSGMSFRFRGNAISVCFTPFDTVEPVYVRVTVDGKARRFCLTSGQERVIVEGLQNRVHDFELLKVSESPFRICPSEIIINGITPAIYPTVNNNTAKPKIEFIGDSLTAGYGNLSEPTVTVYLAAEQDSTRAYPYIVSKFIGAEAHYVCFSGKGIVNSWNGEREYEIPEIFTTASRETKEPWDFNSWTPDVVMVNAGTNDYNGGVQDEEFIEYAKKFLEFIRSKYPDAYIVWAYGLTTVKAEPALKKAVEEFNDPKVSYLHLPSMYEYKDEIGGNGHPNAKCHARTAKLVAKYIKKLCGISARSVKPLD